MADKFDHDLLDTEEVLARARRHWIVLFHGPPKRVLVSVVVILVLLLVVLAGTWPLRLIALAVLVGAGWLRWKTWRLDELAVTDRRVLRRYGFLTTRKAHISLLRVSDITTTQTLTGKSMNYHRISIESASEHPALSSLTYVHNAQDFIDQLRNQVYGRPGDRVSSPNDPYRTDPLPRLSTDDV